MNTLLQALQQASRQQASSNVDVKRLSPGSVVVVRSGFGSSAPETVTLEGVEFDGKNGRATIDYTDKDGDGRWAYIDQIDRVVQY